ncbi:glycosyltransferase family 2 protein [Candidatus Pacearchaeota archaeon]|nr:MAG: glycosyltransferase family 2 protein [Candidatus Pacearchaeota archaeon]
MKVSVIIPTLNAEKFIGNLLKNLIKVQTLKPDEIIVVDSSSTDNTLKIVKNYGCKVISISRERFNHGGTRTLAGKQAKGEILIYFTQDAYPYDRNTLKNIVDFLISDPKLAGVYGKQVPYEDADIYAKFFRYFNYPKKSFVRTLEDRKSLGRKTVFFSNSFSAYKKDALEKVGWFKENLISYEDIYIAARFLISGYKIGYAAEAKVWHSHKTNFKKDFKRHLVLGMFFRDEKWILETFGKKPKDEGLSMIKEFIKFVEKEKKFWKVPSFLGVYFLRKLAFFLGYYYKYFSSL